MIEVADEFITSNTQI